MLQRRQTCLYQIRRRQHQQQVTSFNARYHENLVVVRLTVSVSVPVPVLVLVLVLSGRRQVIT